MHTHKLCGIAEVPDNELNLLRVIIGVNGCSRDQEIICELSQELLRGKTHDGARCIPFRKRWVCFYDPKEGVYQHMCVVDDYKQYKDAFTHKRSGSVG